MADASLPRRDLLKGLACTPLALAARGIGRRALPRVDEIAREFATLDRAAAFARLAELRRLGLSPREALGAVLLAGITEIRPRPVGFKLHAVMMVASAHDIVQRCPERARWLPVFWNLGDLKRAQERDVAEGDWRLEPAGPGTTAPDAVSRLEAAVRADDADPEDVDRTCRDAFVSADADEAFDALWPRAVGDYHNLGHKPIHAAQCRRALDHLGWQHGEPVLRGVAFALIAPGNERARAAEAAVGKAAASLRAGWADGACEPGAARTILARLRPCDAEAAVRAVATASGEGASAATLWDAMRLRAIELLYNRPGLLAVHPLTALNAFRTIAARTARETTRRAALLQCAAWLGNYRGDLRVGDGARALDALTPLATDDPPERVFTIAAEDRDAAMRAALHHAATPPGRAALGEAASAVLVRKAREHHDYKFAAAVLAEAAVAHEAVAPFLLAGACSYLRHAGEPDSPDVTAALRSMAV